MIFGHGQGLSPEKGKKFLANSRRISPAIKCQTPWQEGRIELMTFGLISWLKQKHPDLTYEVPVWYPAAGGVDHREWLVVNGLGGYSSGTISGANRRRYHGLLVSALNPPRDSPRGSYPSWMK